MRRRAVLINTTTGAPIDPSWQPLIDELELEEGNRRLAANELPMQWHWTSSLITLAGALTLSAQAHSNTAAHAAGAILAAGPGL